MSPKDPLFLVTVVLNLVLTALVWTLLANLAKLILTRTSARANPKTVKRTYLLVNALSAGFFVALLTTAVAYDVLKAMTG